MGQQHRATAKRRRRKAYLERKKQNAKAAAARPEPARKTARKKTPAE